LLFCVEWSYIWIFHQAFISLNVWQYIIDSSNIKHSSSIRKYIFNIIRKINIQLIWISKRMYFHFHWFEFLKKKKYTISNRYYSCSLLFFLNIAKKKNINGNFTCAKENNIRVSLNSIFWWRLHFFIYTCYISSIGMNISNLHFNISIQLKSIFS